MDGLLTRPTLTGISFGSPLSTLQPGGTDLDALKLLNWLIEGEAGAESPSMNVDEPAGYDWSDVVVHDLTEDARLRRALSASVHASKLSLEARSLASRERGLVVLTDERRCAALFDTTNLCDMQITFS